MRYASERGFRPESEPPAPSIRLEFFRHDEKGKAATSGSMLGDEFVRLTQKGREHSMGVGRAKDPHPEVGLAYGSTRERSTEAALRQLLSEEEDIKPGDSLEDIQRKIGEQLKIGKKNMVSDKLNFDWDGSREFHNASYGRHQESKDALMFLLEDSDKLVEEFGDIKSTSYSRAAANVAELIKKYIDIFPNWEKIVAKYPDKYAQYQNEMQRFLGSHQTVPESFLIKAIEKLEGREAAKKFIESLPDENGFGFGEGFSARIVRGNDGDAVVKIEFKGREWTVAPQTIRGIIQDRDVLDRGIKMS